MENGFVQSVGKLGKPIADSGIANLLNVSLVGQVQVIFMGSTNLAIHSLKPI